ncbi:MAG: DUF4080 domain-containing protein [Desulfopila sp.]|jgi:hypothetical protein|nr:DUF4080 domain-containing protein [Desulfopila sp.]
MKFALIGLNARYTHSCLALFYVRNELQRHFSEKNIDIKQFTINDPYYELVLQLSSLEADYYCFSASIWNSDLIVRLVDDLLRIDPGIFCIVGGPQAERVGKASGNRRCIAVCGAIERVDPQFYRDLEKRALKETYSANRHCREFSFPYVEADFRNHLRDRHIYYETSRGCPFSCTYCLSSAQQGVYQKEMDEIKKELTFILNWNPAVVRFVDRTFNADTQKTLAIWRFLAEQRSETVFHFEMSPDRFTEEMFTFLAQLPAGRFQFEIGIQSTHQKTLAAIRRQVDTEKASRAIQRLSRMGNIHLHVDLILGLPFETKSSFLLSFRDVFSMEPQYIQMGLLKILPNTHIFHCAEEYGYCYSSTPPYSVLASKWMDHRTLREMFWFSECVEKFLNTRYFVSLWGYFRSIAVDIVVFFHELVEVCYRNSFFQRAPTQDLLCAMILECVEKRDDRFHILELLRYDWMRCGHRFLPERLTLSSEMNSAAIKKKLFRRLENVETCGCEGDKEKMFFLKKGFFLEFSSECLEKLGYEIHCDRHYLCFVPERDNGIFRFCRAALFSLREIEPGEK